MPQGTSTGYSELQTPASPSSAASTRTEASNSVDTRCHSSSLKSTGSYLSHAQDPNAAACCGSERSLTCAPQPPARHAVSGPA